MDIPIAPFYFDMCRSLSRSHTGDDGAEHI